MQKYQNLRMSICEENGGKRSKTEISFFKLIFSKKGVDKCSTVWYYTRAQQNYGGKSYVYIYGKTC